jgi:threonine dehydrogenase-like Zn-dependent dehydrogenase
VPDDLPDAAAVLIEPFACAIHAVQSGLRAAGASARSVLVVGAGTLGLLTVLALRLLGRGEHHIVVAARHPRQRERALALGASQVVEPTAAVAAVRRRVGAHRLDPELGQPFLLDGVDLSFACAGSAAALDLALRTTRAGGRVVLAGLPAPSSVDLAPLWFRELELVGAYAAAAGFATALDAARQVPLGDLLSAIYPLGRWREAIDHALDAGRLGATRVAFDPRAEV